MAVTRADKTTELESLEGAFKGHDVAILIDYKGINVPQVTQLRTDLRKAKATYKVVKNSLAKRALKGTQFETLSTHFEGMTAVAYTKDDPVALAKALTTFMKNAPTLKIKAAVVQGQAIKGADVAALARHLVSGRDVRDPLLRLADRERSADDLLRQPLLVIRRGQRHQGLRVPSRKLAGADPIAHGRP